MIYFRRYVKKCVRYFDFLPDHSAFLFSIFFYTLKLASLSHKRVFAVGNPVNGCISLVYTGKTKLLEGCSFVKKRLVTLNAVGICRLQWLSDG